MGGIFSSTVTNPGPDMLVTEGASVTLSLFSGDGFAHIFCVDYECTPLTLHAIPQPSHSLPILTVPQPRWARSCRQVGQIQSEANSVISLSWTRVNLIPLHQHEGGP